MDSFNPSGIYSPQPCPGGGCGMAAGGMMPGGMPTAGNSTAMMTGMQQGTTMSGFPAAPGSSAASSHLPSLEDIAEFNYLSPQQQQSQRESLHDLGYSPFRGNPRNLAQAPQNVVAPIPPNAQPMPMTAESLQYMNGFLRTQIGRPVTVEFLIGTNTLVDRTGTLLGVGVNYILLNEIETDDVIACDFYNIKFIKFYY